MMNLRIVAIVGTLCLIFASFVAASGTRPPITGRDTLPQIDPRRLPTPPINENTRIPQNMRPAISRTWIFNGRVRSSSWLDTTGRNLETLNGRRAIYDQAGRLRTNSNRTTLIRRRSAVPRR